MYYNPSEVSFEELCGVFFGRIDPTQVNGQGGDRGTQYRTGIYPHTKEQEEVVRGLSPPSFFVFLMLFFVVQDAKLKRLRCTSASAVTLVLYLVLLLLSCYYSVESRALRVPQWDAFMRVVALMW